MCVCVCVCVCVCAHVCIIVYVSVQTLSATRMYFLQVVTFELPTTCIYLHGIHLNIVASHATTVQTALIAMENLEREL